MCFPSLIRQWGKEAVACCPSGRKDWAHTEASSAQQTGRGTPAPFYAPWEVFTFNLLSFPPFAPPWFTERIPYIHPPQWALSPAPKTFRAVRQVPQLPECRWWQHSPWLVVPAVNSPAEWLPCPSSGSLPGNVLQLGGLIPASELFTGSAAHRLCSDYTAAHISLLPILLPFLPPQTLTSRTLPGKLAPCTLHPRTWFPGTPTCKVYVKTLGAL